MASFSPLLLMIIFSTWLLISHSESTEYLVAETEDSWEAPFLGSLMAPRQRIIPRDPIGPDEIEYDNKVNEDDCNTMHHSKMGLNQDHMAVKKRPLVLPPLITLPLSPSPAPSPNSSGAAAAARRFIVWLEVSLAMMMFLIWL